MSGPATASPRISAAAAVRALALRLAGEGGVSADPGGELAEPDEDDDSEQSGDDRIGVEAGEAVAEAEEDEGRLDRLVPRECGDKPERGRGEGDHGLNEGAAVHEGAPLSGRGG